MERMKQDPSWTPNRFCDGGTLCAVCGHGRDLHSEDDCSGRPQVMANETSSSCPCDAYVARNKADVEHALMRAVGIVETIEGRRERRSLRNDEVERHARASWRRRQLLEHHERMYGGSR